MRTTKEDKNSGVRAPELFPVQQRRVKESDDAAISFHAGRDYMTGDEHDDEMHKGSPEWLLTSWTVLGQTCVS